MTNKPLQTFRSDKAKSVQVTAWPTRNGGISYTIRKSYKDKATSEWKESKYFYSQDFEALAEIATWIASFEASATNEPPSSPEPVRTFTDDDIPY